MPTLDAIFTLIILFAVPILMAIGMASRMRSSLLSAKIKFVLLPAGVLFFVWLPIVFIYFYVCNSVYGVVPFSPDDTNGFWVLTALMIVDVMIMLKLFSLQRSIE